MTWVTITCDLSAHCAKLSAMICRTRPTSFGRSHDVQLALSKEGSVMKEKIQNWLHDLGVALGLIEPPLQPIPIRTDDEQRRPRRR